jgi:hypothetical protein
MSSPVAPRDRPYPIGHFGHFGRRHDLIAKIIRDDPEVEEQFRKATTGAVGTNQHSDIVTTLKPERGNSRPYRLSRLKRARPDLFERVVAGELSANAASIAEQPRKRRRSAKATTLIPNTRFIRKMLSISPPIAAQATMTAERALARAREQFSELSGDGIRVYPGTAPQPIHADQVETAMAFLKLLQPIKQPAIDSGTLKHDCENWGSVNGLCAYVSRGALTAAAIGLGYPVRAYRYGPHVAIGVSLKDLKGLNAETLARRRANSITVAEQQRSAHHHFERHGDSDSSTSAASTKLI